MFNKFLKFEYESFVNLSKRAKWCPGKQCEYIIETEKGKPIDI